MADMNIEKLTSKLYQVTDRMDDQDALKWRLRAVALELSEGIIRSKYEASFSAIEASKKQSDFLFENIISLLGFAASQFHIARSNFETLQREYKNIQDEIEPLNIEHHTAEIHKESTHKKAISEPVENTDKEIAPEPFVRQNKIMNYLTERHVASIGELVIFFENSVSDKTLQRDLGELVAQGKVRADGEKRWRVYSLATA